MKEQEQLPVSVLAELYGKSLVFIDEIKKEAEPADRNISVEKLYLGDYKKNVVVLVDDAANVFLDDESLQFLSGILNACKLNLSHIALINFNKNNLKFAALKKELKPEYLLLFGITALQIELPFTMPDYQVQQYSNCKILIAPALTDLNNASAKAVAEKKKLWSSLKNMFSIEK
jgi:hypothetical protein